MDQTNARLLDALQKSVPMVARPYKELGDLLGVSEREVIERIVALREEGIIRQISAIFDSAALGYTSSLVAFAVEEDMLDSVAKAVAQENGVSHCYARENRFNLWFTMTVEPGETVADAVAPLAKLKGVKSYLLLPATKVFKVGVFLKMTDGDADSAASSKSSSPSDYVLTDVDKAVVRALQQDLPAIERPFDALAEQAGMTVDELLDRGKKMQDQGLMRRFAAVLRHRSAGYKANAMVCWRGSGEKIAEIGPKLAANPAVSHCYEREVFPEWPYALYTMIHARTEEELEETIQTLSQAAETGDYLVLHTVKEYKKSRVVYF